jgi:hypothetical protein
MHLRHRITLAVTFALGGCAHTRAPASVHAAQLDERLVQCDALIGASQLDAAIRCARSVEESGDYERARRASYARVTALLYKNDYSGALQALAGMMQRDRAAGNAAAEALGHDASAWVYVGLGSRASALNENERVRQIVERSNLGDEVERQVLLQYWWNRAYLMLDFVSAHSASVWMQGAGGVAAVRAAQYARQRYEALARPPDQHDRQAALAAYFAILCDGAREHYESEGEAFRHDLQVALGVCRPGDVKAARDSALTVDPAKEDDVRALFDAWLVVFAAGDLPRANAIKHRIDKSHPSPMQRLLQMELRRWTA